MMSTDTELKAEKKKGGRPVGYSPAKAPKDINSPKEPPLISEDGDYLVIRVSKKAVAKLLLKDLF